MQEVLKFGIGIFVLVLGFFIGDFLAKKTKEELKCGGKWFKLICLVCLIGSLVSLVSRQDVYLFSFLFIFVVTSRSLKRGL
ncbi:MAG: hypothetical protein PVJ67_06655 [Candidatus Pacearchaeota archaeon]|jgi:hypothetical protein